MPQAVSSFPQSFTVPPIVLSIFLEPEEDAEWIRYHFQPGDLDINRV